MTCFYYYSNCYYSCLYLLNVFMIKVVIISSSHVLNINNKTYTGLLLLSSGRVTLNFFFWASCFRKTTESRPTIKPQICVYKQKAQEDTVRQSTNGDSRCCSVEVRGVLSNYPPCSVHHVAPPLLPLQGRINQPPVAPRAEDTAFL